MLIVTINDRVIRRFQSSACYFGTVVILCCMGQCGLAVTYGFIAISLLASDEAADDLAENIPFEDLAILQNAGHSTFEEADGWRLLDWDVQELLNAVIYDPRLPQSYALISAYIEILALNDQSSSNAIYKNPHNNIGDTKFLIQKKLLQSKLRLDQKFEAKFSQQGILARFDILKFKGVAIVANAFIVDSYISTGIYPCHEYDFELYFVDAVPLDCLFLDYQLISNKNSNLLNALPNLPNALPNFINAPSNTKVLMKLVTDKLAPKRWNIHSFLAGDKSYDDTN